MKYAVEEGKLFLVDPELELNIIEPFMLPMILFNADQKKEQTKEIKTKFSDEHSDEHKVFTKDQRLENCQLPEGYQLMKMLDKNGMEEIWIEKEGKREGQALCYDSEGNVFSCCFYLQNQLHGPSLFFSKQKMVLSESWFYRGNREGIFKQFYSSGKLYSVQKFRENRCHKNQKYFYEDGKIKSLLEYHQGKLHGWSILYWPSGQKKRETFFQEGKREGMDRIFNEKGFLIEEENFQSTTAVKACK